jgi:hypothetical protein
MHLDKAIVKTTKHGPKALITVEGGFNDIDIDIPKNLLRGEAQEVEGRSKSGWQVLYLIYLLWRSWHYTYSTTSPSLCSDF